MIMTGFNGVKPVIRRDNEPVSTSQSQIPAGPVAVTMKRRAGAGSACTNCLSEDFYEDIGGLICAQCGVQSQDYVNEEFDDDDAAMYGAGGRIYSQRNERAKKVRPTSQPVEPLPEATECLQLFQFALQMIFDQVLKESEVTDATTSSCYQKTLKNIWMEYLQQWNRAENLCSIASAFTKFPVECACEKRRAGPEHWTHPIFPSKSLLMGLIYLALRVLRSAVLPADLVRWAESGRLSFLNLYESLPLQWRKLPTARIFTAQRERMPTPETVFYHACRVAQALRLHPLPPLNAPLVAQRMVRRLGLPPEVWGHYSKIAQLFTTATPLLGAEGVGQQYPEPLMALLVVACKSCPDWMAWALCRVGRLDGSAEGAAVGTAAHAARGGGQAYDPAQSLTFTGVAQMQSQGQSQGQSQSQGNSQSQGQKQSRGHSRVGLAGAVLMGEGAVPMPHSAADLCSMPRAHLPQWLVQLRQGRQFFAAQTQRNVAGDVRYQLNGAVLGALGGEKHVMEQGHGYVGGVTYASLLKASQAEDGEGEGEEAMRFPHWDALSRYDHSLRSDSQALRGESVLTEDLANADRKQLAHLSGFEPRRYFGASPWSLDPRTAYMAFIRHADDGTALFSDQYCALLERCAAYLYAPPQLLHNLVMTLERQMVALSMEGAVPKEHESDRPSLKSISRRNPTAREQLRVVDAKESDCYMVNPVTGRLTTQTKARDAVLRFKKKCKLLPQTRLAGMEMQAEREKERLREEAEEAGEGSSSEESDEPVGVTLATPSAGEARPRGRPSGQGPNPVGRKPVVRKPTLRTQDRFQDVQEAFAGDKKR